MLRTWIEGGHAPPALRLRARIVVLSGAGLGPAAVARELGCSTQTVVAWRERFRVSGTDGLRDARRSGRPVTVDAEAVICATVLPGGGGHPPWSTRSLARHLGVSNVTVANVWRRWGVRPQPSGRVRLLLDPGLDRLPIAVLGLYVDRAVRLAAVLVDSRDGPAPPDGRHAGFDPRLLRLLAAPGGAHSPDGRTGDAGLGRFLRGLGGIVAGIGADGAPVAVHLIVEGTDEPIRRWVRDHPVAVVHLAPPPSSWERVVLVACLGAGAVTPGGRAPIDRLRASPDQLRGTPFSWATWESG